MGLRIITVENQSNNQHNPKIEIENQRTKYKYKSNFNKYIFDINIFINFIIVFSLRLIGFFILIELFIVVRFF